MTACGANTTGETRSPAEEEAARYRYNAEVYLARTIGRKKLLLAVLFVLLGSFGTYELVARYNDPARIVKKCAHSDNKSLCYATEVESVLRARGIPAAFDVLAVAYDTDTELAATCHAVTHELGAAAYEEFHKTGNTELTSKASYCGYGFYHGFMDALYLDTNNMEEARAFCTYVGNNVPHPPPPEFAEGSCYHGIGHGITDGTDPRLWGDALAILKPGLAICDKVAAGNDSWHMRCVSGVFNGLGNMYTDPRYKLDSGTDPYELCRTGPFTDLERETCYDQMNTQAAFLGNNNLEAIVAFGKNIKNLHYRSVAIHEAVSLYIWILKGEKKSLAPEQVAVCELSTETLKKNCVSGFVGGIMEFGTPERQYEEILQLCGADAFPNGLRTYCFSSLQQLSRYYYTPKLLGKICTRVPDEYRDTNCQL